MTIGYNEDIVAWANEQAAFIRSGQFALLDLENIAEEILDVGKSEHRELASRMSVLLAYLLKWKFQPEKQSKSWKTTVRVQRKLVKQALLETPSLKTKLSDFDWWDTTYGTATNIFSKETGLEDFPDICPWTTEDILTDDWLPD